MSKKNEEISPIDLLMLSIICVVLTCKFNFSVRSFYSINLVNVVSKIIEKGIGTKCFSRHQSLKLFDTVRSFHYYFSPAGMYVFKSKIETLDWYAE